MLTLYTRPGCQPCIATKRHLDRLSIPYQVEDLTPYDAARFREAGHQEAPVVVAPTGTWSGYQPGRIDALLGE
ncbi:glutaredoxin family protein [Pseudogemmobacter sonorensis]|uniref:glutaredoxin family protein n=1 Tax=Pseudogemmobacter sonorensis TaxID=2989681 RepID=UPI0036CBE9DC